MSGATFRFAKLEQSFYLLSFAICAALHLATFVIDISFLWVLPAAFFVGLGIICSKLTPRGRSLQLPLDAIQILGFILLAYSIILFIYDYKTTGGANGVAVVDGQCVALNKSTVIRSLTDYECNHFPSLWTRVMSAWIAMMACFGLVHPYTVSAKMAR
jgi:hypothetical protein